MFKEYRYKYEYYPTRLLLNTETGERKWIDEMKGVICQYSPNDSKINTEDIIACLCFITCCDEDPELLNAIHQSKLPDMTLAWSEKKPINYQELFQLIGVKEGDRYVYPKFHWISLKAEGNILYTEYSPR